MTARQRKLLGRYVRHVADRLGLREWTFDLHYGHTDAAEAMAEIEITYGRRSASISFSDGFESLEPEERRMAVVHELVHAHHHEMMFLALNLAETMGDAVEATFRTAYKQAEELATDLLATSIAPHFALPED